MQNVEIRKFKKVLVANRGEIAIRVYRALNELGIQTVGIFSKEDKYALFRTKTDEAYMLNPEKGPLDAYLDINKHHQNCESKRCRCDPSRIWVPFRKSRIC